MLTTKNLAKSPQSKALPMRSLSKLKKGWNRKMRAATFGRLARIFLLHPFLSFSRERIGSALQGVPWAPRGTPRAVLDPLPPQGSRGRF